MLLMTGLAVRAGTTGSDSCPCVSSLRKFSGGGDITAEIKGIMHNYGSQYGLTVCAAHDLERPPLCDRTMPWLRGDVPAWCPESWCYVDPLNCTAHPHASVFVPGAHYSYETCGDSSAVFSGYGSKFSGYVHLCSVFSLKDVSRLEVADQAAASGPCGNTQTHLQVEGMVRAINALNNGRGFPVHAGSLEPVYLALTYNWTTYPFGQWEEVGRDLSESYFASCDLVVGMANGCPDAEIVQQALLANASRKMYDAYEDALQAHSYHGRATHPSTPHKPAPGRCTPALLKFYRVASQAQGGEWSHGHQVNFCGFPRCGDDPVVRHAVTAGGLPLSPLHRRASPAT